MKPAGLKAAIIAGCVVLSVLTTAPGAHAGRYHDFKCANGVVVHTAQNQYRNANGERDVSKDTYGIQIEDLRNPNNVHI
jgi:hypothetical protein